MDIWVYKWSSWSLMGWSIHFDRLLRDYRLMSGFDPIICGSFCFVAIFLFESHLSLLKKLLNLVIIFELIWHTAKNLLALRKCIVQHFPDHLPAQRIAVLQENVAQKGLIVDFILLCRFFNLLLRLAIEQSHESLPYLPYKLLCSLKADPISLKISASYQANSSVEDDMQDKHAQCQTFFLEAGLLGIFKDQDLKDFFKVWACEILVVLS